MNDNNTSNSSGLINPIDMINLGNLSIKDNGSSNSSATFSQSSPEATSSSGASAITASSSQLEQNLRFEQASTSQSSSSQLTLPMMMTMNTNNAAITSMSSSMSAQGLNYHNFDEGEAGATNNATGDKSITKLFVGNLPTSTTLPELLEVFRKYGPINEALSVVKDHNYAFIHFYRREDAEVALREVNDSLFKNRYIRVQFSTSKGFTSKPKNSDRKRINNSMTFANISSLSALNQATGSGRGLTNSYSSYSLATSANLNPNSISPNTQAQLAGLAMYANVNTTSPNNTSNNSNNNAAINNFRPITRSRTMNNNSANISTGGGMNMFMYQRPTNESSSSLSPQPSSYMYNNNNNNALDYRLLAGTTAAMLPGAYSLLTQTGANHLNLNHHHHHLTEANLNQLSQQSAQIDLIYNLIRNQSNGFK